MTTCSRPRCEYRATARGLCNRHYLKWRYVMRERGQWDAPMDSTGAARRLQALAAAGWRVADIARHSGLSAPTVNYLMHRKRERVYPKTYSAVVAVYDKLSMRQGYSTRARRRAERLGWAPPLAWDDDTIDDPTAEPDLGAKRAVLFPERYAEWRELGYSDLEILGRMQIHPESLLRQLDRYGIKPDPELVREATSRKHRKAVS